MSELILDGFTSEKREKYLVETVGSLDAILNDAFLGEDQNQLKALFPPGTKREDLELESTKVSLTYKDQAEEPIIEIVARFSYKNVAVGEYNSVYDLGGEILDELFFME